MDKLLPSFFGPKVVTATEMARVEKLAVESGCSEEAFIQTAGKQVAAYAMQFIEERGVAKSVLLLVGKGNKGADAYAAGTYLLEEGYKVRAFMLFPPEECGKWNRKFGEKFLKGRGKVDRVWDGGEMVFTESLLIDGILGTGFKGKVGGAAELAIQLANASKKPILAIDLPSGLDGSSGEVRGACISACETITLGLAKSGLFLRDGWNYCGKIHVADFGLPEKFVEMAQEVAYLPIEEKLPKPKMVRNRHKYQAGYVLGVAGSEEMRGAPKLAGLAALRGGAGIVRIFHEGEIGEAPYELICQKWNEKAFVQELKRASAVFVGPGLGSKKRLSWLKKITLPIVLDADALQKGMQFPKNAVITPHRGEMLRLLGLKAAGMEEEFLGRCKKFVERQNVVLVLKGAPTWIFAHGHSPLIIPRGDPGMATAGSGDVLTGLIAALLAQKLSLLEAAATGVYLHAVSGEIGAFHKSSYGLIASDLIEFLPIAFQDL